MSQLRRLVKLRPIDFPRQARTHGMPHGGEGFEVIGIDNDLRAHYPAWKFRYGLNAILNEIHAACAA